MLGLDPHLFWLAFAVTGFAGFVKGAIGFAMPMIMMSAFGSFLPPTTALALLIMPTLVTNLVQALRQGTGPAIDSTRKFGWHIAMVVIFIIVSAGFASSIPQSWMYFLLGAPITLFALWQLAGRSLRLPVHHLRRFEIVSGIIGGLYGGVSGIWGPPLIVMLLSTDTPKEEQIRVQGVVFLIGAVTLVIAHLASGVLSGPNLWASLAMVVPAMIGMRAGFMVQDRLNVAQFRRWTQGLLALSGLNLVRRAIELGLI
ncbi:sulfite exporter TauE/SafE family protein [Paracoccus suum]|uniref:Probable membrane transporter protein n=1 Tax=Paracoccus suum TaxID=2259340 RepID=A0A344PNK7_9RHOB|nr:sulfite exporter TauE/SafE family protein [Paracoccus suum]